MINSRAFDLLKTFSRKEFRLLGDYIASPIHNKNEKLIRLYDRSARYYPDFSSRNFNKEKIYSVLFPDEGYNDNRLRKLFSAYLNICLEFLAYNCFSSAPAEKGISLLKALMDKDQEDLFEKKLNETTKYVKKNNIRSDYFLERFMLENRKNSYKNQKYAFYSDVYELNESESLIRYFLLNIMRRYAALFIKQFDLKINFKPNMLPEILKYLKLSTYDDVPELRLYCLLFNLLRDEDNEENLVFLKQYLNENSSVLETPDLYNAYTLLSNIYLKKTDYGCSKLALDLLEIYKTQLKLKAHKTGKYMSHVLYRNIANIAVRLKDFGWAENFIKDYKAEITPGLRENSYNYLVARLSFFNNEHQKSLQFMSKVNYDDYYHKLDIYAFKLRIFYETDAVEAMLSLIDSYKHLLAKDNFIPAHRMNEYKSFLKFMTALALMKARGNYSKAGYYKNELLKVHQVSCSGWFIEKFFELEKY